MSSLVRDSPAGQLIRLVTGNKLLKYAEEKDNFKIPDTWLPTTKEAVEHGPRQDLTPLGPGDVESQSHLPPIPSQPSQACFVDDGTSTPSSQQQTKGHVILVDWYSPDDPDNPRNWSNLRRAWITTFLYLYTSVIYMSSAIYMPSEAGVEEEFGVSPTESALGLALFVLGYGVGPLLFSPIGEIASVGRGWVYSSTMFIYVIISIAAALPDNYAGLMVLRFLQGFFGSPCLASSGATLSDMYELIDIPYALIGWVSAIWCGPALGPLIAGFSVPVMGWRWSMLEALWAACALFLVMLFLLPETSHDHILLKRAQRIRRLTRDDRYVSEGELSQAKLTASQVVGEALIRPFEVTFKDPAMLFIQVYTSIVYGVYYSYFEVFPIVYEEIYGMTLGQMGIVFQCIFVANAIGIVVYASYLAFHLNPRIKAHGFPVQEVRLFPAMLTSFGVTIGLFVFAWTSRPDIHWIASVIGIVIYSSDLFVVMQCIFVYISVSYPRYSASLFAANDFCRSALACGCVLFGRPLFRNLGVGRGVSVLAGLSALGIIGIWILYVYGGRLRAKSKFATNK